MTLTPDQQCHLVDAMHRYGGGFVNALASAMERADGRNRQRLLDTFPDIVNDYGPGGLFYRKS